MDVATRISEVLNLSTKELAKIVLKMLIFAKESNYYRFWHKLVKDLLYAEQMRNISDKKFWHVLNSKWIYDQHNQEILSLYCTIEKNQARVERCIKKISKKDALLATQCLSNALSTSKQVSDYTINELAEALIQEFWSYSSNQREVLVEILQQMTDQRLLSCILDIIKDSPPYVFRKVTRTLKFLKRHREFIRKKYLNWWNQDLPDYERILVFISLVGLRGENLDEFVLDVIINAEKYFSNMACAEHIKRYGIYTLAKFKTSGAVINEILKYILQNEVPEQILMAFLQSTALISPEIYKVVVNLKNIDERIIKVATDGMYINTTRIPTTIDETDPIFEIITEKLTQLKDGLDFRVAAKDLLRELNLPKRDVIRKVIDHFCLMTRCRKIFTLRRYYARLFIGLDTRETVNIFGELLNNKNNPLPFITQMHIYNQFNYFQQLPNIPFLDYLRSTELPLYVKESLSNSIDLANDCFPPSELIIAISQADSPKIKINLVDAFFRCSLPLKNQKKSFISVNYPSEWEEDEIIAPLIEKWKRTLDKILKARDHL